LANHLDSTTYGCSGCHDVVEDEHALSGDRNTNQAPAFAVVLCFLAIVRKSNVNPVLSVEENRGDGGK
jgi:hypothetical protein